MAHLHRKNVIHRTSNQPISLIFIQKSGDFEKPQIKLSDFGISNILQAGVRVNENIEHPFGSRGWIAPGMYHSSEHFDDLEADIFPLGCVFGYTLTGGNHLFGEYGMEREDRIVRGDGTIRLVIDDLNTPQSDNRSAFELLNSMLNRDPNGRPSAEDILNSTRPEPYLHSSHAIIEVGSNLLILTS